MIKAEIDGNSFSELELDGDFFEIADDVQSLISAIYSSSKKEVGEDCAEMFKKLMIDAFEDVDSLNEMFGDDETSRTEYISDRELGKMSPMEKIRRFAKALHDRSSKEPYDIDDISPKNDEHHGKD